MKKYIGALLIFLVTTTAIFAQINFEKGYFISEDGEKTECYIKNEDWIYNPSRFEYKLSPDGDIQIVQMTAIKTVVIDNAFRFEKHIVPYNDANFEFQNLTHERSPQLNDTELLLKVLVKGKVSLYSYRDGAKSSFYYQKDYENFQPLIYNVYISKYGKLLYNKRYQQQLITEFPCTQISEKKASRIDYDASDLKSFFKQYNKCKGASSVEFSKAKKAKFQLKAFAGVYYGSETSELTQSPFFVSASETVDIWSPTFGLELEYFFPFNKNKWSLFLAPNYSSYTSKSVNDNPPSNERTLKLEYSAIQIPFGIRYYMFTDDTSKVFVSGGMVFDIPLKRDISGSVMIVNDIFETGTGATIGLGYSFRKYSIEARYITKRNLLGKLNVSGIKFQQIAITLGYTIF